MIGNLSKETLDKIRKSLPKLPDDWLDVTYPEQFSFKLNDLNKGETTHISLVCLHDAFRRSESAVQCLFDCYANMHWYRNEKVDIEDHSREFFAVWKGKFYAEYNFLFLYAIGEDIADFVLYYLTKESEFKKWITDPFVKKKLEKKKITSKAAKVGVFMAELYPGDVVTEAILRLKHNSFWIRAMKYRNTWVHEKPPILEGLGLEYSRENKIVSDDNSIGFGIGSWSKPHFKIDEVATIAHQATNICVEVLTLLLENVRDMRNRLGTPVV